MGQAGVLKFRNNFLSESGSFPFKISFLPSPTRLSEGETEMVSGGRICIAPLNSCLAAGSPMIRGSGRFSLRLEGLY